jgi:N-acetylmuramoyl-L-alanine amidase
VGSGSGRITLALLAAGWASSGFAASVESLRIWSGPESTRVVLDLSAPADHRLFQLSDPDRVVIDLPGARLGSRAAMPEGRGAVSSLRTGARPGGELRVVIDLSQNVSPRSFLLPPNEQYGHRLVIDLLPGRGESAVRRAPQTASASGRPLIVAIDAGHGGEDPGAIGRRGVREKDVTLAIARRLAEEIQRDPGLQPVLIRNGDYFLSLRRRIEIAHAAQADLFISIHADAYHDSRARGATVYALSQKGASDEAARRLAERENAADLIGGVSLADKDHVLAQVLLDLSQNAAISASTAVGERVIRRLNNVTPMRRTEVQAAPFLVLKSPDIPSLLIETAYISNPNEEQALHDPAHQQRLARAIYAGIVDYFMANPPPGSHIALVPRTAPATEPVRHVIGPGETLSGIAARYRVSVAAIRRSNSLNSDVVRTGQVLTIPPG